VFRYWRLLRLSREEARMLLLDIEWGELRREMSRVEKWRAWAQPKLKLPRGPEPANTVKGIGCGKAILIIGAIIVVCLLGWCLLF